MADMSYMIGGVFAMTITVPPLRTDDWPDGGLFYAGFSADGAPLGVGVVLRLSEEAHRRLEREARIRCARLKGEIISRCKRASNKLTDLSLIVSLCGDCTTKSARSKEELVLGEAFTYWSPRVIGPMDEIDTILKSISGDGGPCRRETVKHRW